ncbi:RagB/SusD family nutrient uptake outer membrane protein [Puteibacter caeruleilacunae]|nr:RagB/SusD family nutrient uptake outer membrane protein [Puteibacter caeruleilacunae]
MKKINIKIVVASVLVLFGSVSCTNLDETVYSTITADNFYNTADEVVAAYLRPYSHITVYTQDYWLANELSGDGVAWPQKGKHGYDGGKWQELHWHKWTPTNWTFWQSWRKSYQGVGFCNQVLEDIEKIDFDEMRVPISKSTMQAELRALRAFYYYMLCNDFGDVPIVTKVGETMSPEPKKRAEVFKFIVDELNAIVGDLPIKGDANSYAHFTQGAAYTLLAKMYVNGEVFTGSPKWDECIAACDKVISAGRYSLDTNWQDPFKIDNHTSNENILAIPYDNVNMTGFYLLTRCLHYSHQKGFNLGNMPWNGIVTQPDLYDLYSDDDKRKSQFLVGLQKGLDGEILLGTEEFKDQPLVITKEITSMDKSNEREGARSIKFEVEADIRYHMNNDFPIFRYADVLLMKAECLLRKGEEGDAIILANKVRARAFDEGIEERTYESLTLDELLDERGREFGYEGLRRQDLIRFGKFGGSWWDKQPSDKTKEIFPYPDRATGNNPNLSN